jgi:tetratricopeptide (TPR) repeat protein
VTGSSGETWTRLDSAFAEARALSGEARAEYLARVRRDDPAFAAEVEGLLRSLDSAGSFLEPPAREPDAPSLEGARIGDCRVIRRLGHGGMGAVYEAVQESIGRRVAIKVMRATFGGAAERRRFEHEARWLGQLKHPGVAQVFEVGEHRDGVLGLAFPYCVMELVPDAMPITAWVRARRLDARATIELFLQVCDAVQHAHGRGIIHRDLKPANVLVDATGQPKLIDFGVARPADGGTPRPYETHAGAVVGTLGYMSPEQLAGARDAVDIRTDVWALGVILFELLTGELPIPVASLPFAEALARLRTEAIPAPSQLRPALRGDLEVLILKALAREPGDRYASVVAFADDLRRFLRAEPVLARRPTLVQSLRLFARRHAAAVATAAIVVTVLVAATVVSLLFAFHADEARHAADETTKEVERERATAQALVDRGRAFTNWMIFDFQHRLLAIDGATSAKRELTAAIVSYLDDLAKLKGNDRAVALEIAKAHVQVGSLAGHAYRGGQDDVGAALSHYRKALAALDAIPSRADDPAATSQEALVRFRMAEVLSTSDPKASLVHAGEARALLERLRAKNAHTLQTEGLVADVAWFTGDLHDRLENADAAKKSRELALATLDRIFAIDAETIQKDRVAARNLFELRVKHTDLLMRIGRIEDARRAAEALVAQAGEPGADATLRARNDAGIAARTLGAVATVQGDHAAAAAAYERASKVFEDLFAANPQNPGYVELAVRNLFGRAKALKAEGNPASAAEVSRRALELHERHLAKRLMSVLERRTVLEMWLLHVEAAVESGNQAAATAGWARTVAAAEDVIASPQSDADDRRFAAGLAWKAARFAELQAGKATDAKEVAALLGAARAAYAKALGIGRDLAAGPGGTETDRANVDKIEGDLERLEDKLASTRPGED